MNSNIDILSIISRSVPNSFFESFQVKESDSKYHINVKISVRDYLLFNSNDTGWVTNPSTSDNCYIKIDCITDERLFNLATGENYLELLKNNKNSKKFKLENLSLDVLLKQEAEITTNEENIYKFLYNTQFEIPISDFVGFITYCYYDSVEYSKKLNMNIDSKKLNSVFSIEKIEFIKGKTKNNSLQRMFTSQDNLWCSNYFSDGDIDYYIIKGKKYPLTKKNDQISIIDSDLANSINKTLSKQIKKDTSTVSYENLSSFGDIYSSIDLRGNLNIYFSFDSIGYILKNSNIFLSLGKDAIDDPVIINWIKNLSIIKSIKVVRIDKNLKTEKEIADNTYYDSLTNVGDLDNSFSHIKLYKFTDEEYSYLNNGLYSYRLDFVIDDGVFKYLQKLTSYAALQNEKFKDYLNASRSFADKIDKNNKHIYYDYNSDSFTELYALVQMQEYSEWSKCYDCANSYIMLYNILNEDKLNTTLIDLQKSLSPQNASLIYLEKFANLFDALMKKAHLILDKKTNTDFSDSYLLISNIQTSNNVCYYDYSEDFSSYSSLKKDTIKQYLPFRQIDKLYRITGFSDDRRSTIETADLNNEEQNGFKISNTVTQLLLEELKFKLSEDQISYTHLYNVFSDNIGNMKFLYDCNSAGSAINTILKTKSLEELISIYRNLTGSNEKFISMTKNDFITLNGKYSIQKYIQVNINFLLTFLNKLDDSYYKDYKKLIMFILRYGKLVKVEYLSGYENKDSHNIKLLKKPIWSILDINDAKVNKIITENKTILIRFLPVKTDEIGFFDDSSLDLDIINKYLILGN